MRGRQIEKLDSWKEIAAFLGRDVRTCQRWEKELDLPVHRFESASRPRVFAYRQEIERWIGGLSNDPRLEKQKRGPVPILITLIGGAAVLLAAVLVFRPINRSSCPCDYRIFGSRLIILDKNHRQLWERDTGLDLLENEAHYRTRFQRKFYIAGMNYLPSLIIRDIDGDGNTEILFHMQTTDLNDSNLLICYSESGNELWRFRAGREAVFGGRIVSDDYLIKGIDVFRFSDNSPNRILVFANHRSEFPAQISLLDTSGNKLGEFWNAGRINDYALLDVDHNGRRDLLLAGINAETGQPCCAALDQDRFDGCCPAIKPGYRMEEGRKCSVLAYVLLPIAAAADILGPNGAIERIETSFSEASAAVRLESIVLYTLNFRLELMRVKLLERFLMDYAKTRRSETFDLEPEELIETLMKEGPRFFNGKRYVREPTLLLRAEPES